MIHSYFRIGCRMLLSYLLVLRSGRRVLLKQLLVRLDSITASYTKGYCIQCLFFFLLYFRHLLTLQRRSMRKSRKEFLTLIMR